MKTWAQKYMDLCDFICQWSEDPKKKVGAVLVRDNRVISMGYNGFPTGVDCTHERLHDRDCKLEMIEHAERNAIYTAARMGHDTSGCTMYCNWAPCTDCARGIIQAGITKLITRKPDQKSKWYPKILIAQVMMEEAGIQVEYTELL